MVKKKKRLNFYSTNPDYYYEDGEDAQEETLPKQQQQLRVSLDRKKRRGKMVTLITGFVGKEEDLKDLGKTLKAKCGVGGSTKNNIILIQGNHCVETLALLKSMGYTQTKRTGG